MEKSADIADADIILAHLYGKYLKRHIFVARSSVVKVKKAKSQFCMQAHGNACKCSANLLDIEV